MWLDRAMLHVYNISSLAVAVSFIHQFVVVGWLAGWLAGYEN
jgi:hypothetical protein